MTAEERLDQLIQEVVKKMKEEFPESAPEVSHDSPVDGVYEASINIEVPSEEMDDEEFYKEEA
jgi:hypothetical protein